MFETATVSSGRQSKRMWATCVGFGGQALLVGGMLVAPMIWPQGLPKVAWVATIAHPGAPPPPPPPPPHVEPRNRIPIQSATHALVMPTHIPPRPVQIEDVPDAIAATTGVRVGAEVGVPFGTGDNTKPILFPTTALPPRPPDPPKPVITTRTSETPKPRRITEVQMAEPIQRVNPVYPPLARQMRISGKVELQGVLGTDGRIHELKVISGHPFLVKAAVDAVLQWVYRPTILNGQAVEVQAPITVNFILNQ
jgi:periplasmic protein TonB